MPKPLTFWQQMQTDKAYRKKCVVNSLKKLDANLLFYLAVQQYNKKPSKTKASTIYDLFLGDQAFWKQTDHRNGRQSICIGELDPESNLEDIGLLGNVGFVVAGYKDMRKEAESMNFITRYFTAGSRLATPGVFDKVVEKAKLSPTLQGNAVYGLISNSDGQDPPAQKGWENQAKFGKMHLARAGFDVSDLGLDDIPQANL